MSALEPIAGELGDTEAGLCRALREVSAYEMPASQGRDEPDNQNDGEGEYRSNSSSGQSQKCPVPPGMAVMGGDGVRQQKVVTAVSLPENVKSIAEDGNRPKQQADGKIGQHAQQGDVRNSANPGCKGNDQGKRTRQRIAQAGYEANDSVDSEANASARDDECFASRISSQRRRSSPRRSPHFVQRWLEEESISRLIPCLIGGICLFPALRRSLSKLLRCYNHGCRWRL